MDISEDEAVASASPPPIPGKPVDPPPKSKAKTLAKIEDKSGAAGGGFRAFLRFGHADASLLAAGTTYYAFLALFAIVVAAFGITATLGGEEMANTVSESVSKAFPGLIGEKGVTPEQLKQVGQATSIIGLVILLYSGSGAMVAVSTSLHKIYGAPKDARNFVLARARLLGWLLLLVPLMGLSFVPNVIVSRFARPVMDAVGLDHDYLLKLVALIVGLLINALVIWLMLGHLGGIKPARGPRLIGTIVGAIGIEILKYLLTFIIEASVDKPQYGAFAAPIAMMFVLYLECMVVYLSAAITAGFAEKNAAPEEAADLQVVPA